METITSTTFDPSAVQQLGSAPYQLDRTRAGTEDPQDKGAIHYRLHTKFIVAISVILALLMLATVFIVDRQMQKSILDEFIKRGLSVTRGLASVNTKFVTTYDYINIEQSLDFFVKENELYYAIVMFFDGEVAAYKGSEHIKAKVLSGALHEKAYKSLVNLVQNDQFNGNEFCEISVPILVENEKWGTVRVGFELQHIYAAIARTRNMIILIGVVTIVVAWLAAFFLARRFTKPIGQLVESAEAISEGDYDHQIIISTRDEIGFLGQRFKVMQQTIKQHVDLLTATNSELVATNEKLHNEIEVRYNTEKALRRRDRILKTVAEIGEQLLKEPFWEKCIPDILADLGRTTGVKRLFVLKGAGTEIERHQFDLISEWIALPCGASGDPRHTSSNAASAGDGDRLQAADGAFLKMVPDTGSNSTRRDCGAYLQSGRISHVPILVDNSQWGVIGYEGLSEDAPLKTASIDALTTVATSLGAAIQRKQHFDRIEAANRAKDDFMANMSHELRTPLNHIIGFTELVVDGACGDASEKQKEYLNYSLQGSRHLLSLINDILDLAKVEAGRLELETSEVHLPFFLDSCLNLIKEKALNHEITIEKDIDVDDVVVADERKLRQIMYNILFNAVKFTPDGGTVTVKACMVDCRVEKGRRQEDEPNTYIIRMDGNDVEKKDQTMRRFVHIQVIDSGIGIEDGNLKRIFNRFEQVENAKDRSYQGTGLGLSLAKSFVTLHGGKIWAESKGLNQGSMFTLLIPSRT